MSDESFDHELKTWPCYFGALRDGRKAYELRSTRDRVFKVGHVLLLRECTPSGDYSGRVIRRKVTHIMEGPEFGLAKDWAILSFGSSYDLREL